MVTLLIDEKAQISSPDKNSETLKYVEYSLAFAGLISYNGCMAVLLLPIMLLLTLARRPLAQK